MKFAIGNKVQSKSDPSKIGIIEEIGVHHAGIQYYRVFWGGARGTANVPEVDLEFYQANKNPRENLINRNIAGYQEFQRLMTLQRLLRDFPLRNNIYAFNASRTRFYPYQFKPLIKFLDSVNHRLLICDEVGLGKTIEAGLILTELRARQTVRRVLIVCTANLTGKWKLEMKRRFGEDFRILKVSDFQEYLNEFESELDRTTLNGIISLESLRTSKILDRIEELSPSFDLVIVDEAHHMRNFGRRQRKAGLLLGNSASAMIMLTATPIHLGDENLFSLLNLLDEDEFPSQIEAKVRFRENEPIVRAQTCLGQIPPNLKDGLGFLEKLQKSEWFSKNPLYSDIVKRLTDLIGKKGDSTEERRMLIDLQRDVAEINLLGHIFTRTKKRDVHEQVPKRRAKAILVEFSPLEKAFYNAVTDFIRTDSMKKMELPLITQWRINMPQRRMASSIPAMVRYYKDHFGFSPEDQPEDFSPEDFDLNETTDKEQTFAEAEKKLKEIVKNWPTTTSDSKYDKFVKSLRESKEKGPLKVLVFAFFIDTLTYLGERLQHDGFKTLIISGRSETPEERLPIIEKFRTEPNIEILLSSRVGSEGLDFQFCNTLFNYDLPWNPMEVEQRIGRLDRIGQESQVIHIFNMWIKDSIEERILRRLYDRLQIFEKSIGELEPIIGEVIQTLEKEVFSKNLTPEEEQIQAERVLKIVEQKKNEIDRLEKESAHFIGTDQYFNEEVKAIKERRRYITGEQLRRFFIDFISRYAPKTRLEYNSESQIGRFFPDDDLKTFIRKHHASAELSMFLSPSNRGIEVTFDSQVAFQKAGIEFINVLHPLVIGITEEYKSLQDKPPNAHYILLKTNLVSAGRYFFFIYRLRIYGAKGQNTLETIFLREDLTKACDIEIGETLFGEMVEKGEDSKSIDLDIDPTSINLGCETANKLFLEHLANIRTEVEQSNDRFVARRLESLKAFYERKIRKYKDLLERAHRQERQDRYIRMMEGTIKRLEDEFLEKKQDIEKQKTIQVEYDEISAGVLEVV